MHVLRGLGFACFLAGMLLADGKKGPGGGGDGGGGGGGGAGNEVSLHIPNETSPPDGIAQMKLMVTEPTPISSGRPSFAFDSATFDAVWGIELFDAGGDVQGVAMINGSNVHVAYTQSLPTQGTDYPIMTIALHIRSTALPGTQTTFNLDPSSTWILGLLGAATLDVKPPATITVAGTVSITNVVPGGGMLPAGTVVHLQGIGFQPKTQVQLTNFQASSITVVSSNEIQIVLAAATDMTGKKIQVVNPDGSQDTYFSYMRGIPLGQSNRSILASAVPIFSTVTHTKAVFGPMSDTGTTFTGAAVQNPNLTAVTVTFTLSAQSGAVLGSTTLQVPPGNRLMRSAKELAQGVTPTTGSTLTVSSTQPIQVFGILADSGAGTVSPVAALSAQP